MRACLPGCIRGSHWPSLPPLLLPVSNPYSMTKIVASCGWSDSFYLLSFVIFFFLFFFGFYCYDLTNFKIVLLSLYSDNLIMLEFRNVWEKDCCVCNSCVCNCERREKQGNCVKMLWHHFSLLFSSRFERIKNVGPREIFLPDFLSSPFSFPNQIVEYSVFHPIFLPLFSILPIFNPTKQSLKVR